MLSDLFVGAFPRVNGFNEPKYNAMYSSYTTYLLHACITILSS